MKADSIHLFDFLGNGKTIFEIPVFQRNYEWNKKQCKRLFTDLISAATTGKDHFIGTVVYVSKTGNKMSHIYRIIDGQQRITTLTLLLKALANVNKENKNEIGEEYLINKYLEDNNHFKLKPVEHDYDAFVSIMNNMIGNNQISKMIDNYKLFISLIEKSKLSSSQLYEAMNHFTIVYIELSNNNNEENPQLIFESLNSTGMSLSASDLIRNFLLMQLDYDLQSELYKKYWTHIEQMFSNNVFTEFIRHYLIMKTHDLVNKNNVYDIYKNYYKSRNLTPDEALSDLYKFANFYYKLINSKTGDSTFDKILRHINIMDSKVIFPYLMLLLNLINNGEIEQNDANNLAHILENYIYRIKLCRLPTNRLNGIIVSLCNVEKDNGKLKLRLLKLLKSSFPEDKDVINSLKNNALYRKQNNFAKFTLEILEEHITKETIDFDDAQVEHIMPQKLTPEWRIYVPNADRVNEMYGDTIGNLTLTKYNQEMSNKLYHEKIKFYKNSNISLTRDIANKYKNNWNYDTIIDRSSKLANQILEIFPMPDIKNIIAQEITGDYNINDNIDVTGKKPTSITIGENSYPVNSWRKMLIVFLNDIWDKDSHNFDIIQNNDQLKHKLFNSRKHRVKVLKNGIEIETNYSAMEVLSIINEVAKLCNLNNQVIYTLN